ncbi:MAG: DUF488 domain-containing protein [Acidobacteria bacterium]|nr:DUF488 domain-containing protein [Acidobacteriota bacterium]
MLPSARLKLPTAPVRSQVENKALWNEARCRENADFFTIGYTGRKTGELLDALVAAGVRTLVDIRQNAVSMYRPELSKANLRQLVEHRGLQYVHLPDLGVPRDIRARAIATGSRDVIWSWYDEHVVSSYIGRNLHRFFNGVEHPAAFMCVEIDPRECHRHRLSVALESIGLRGFDL